MANRIDTEPADGGLRVTKVFSTERDIDIPESIGGVPVVAIGPRFLIGCPSAENRKVTFPKSVTDIPFDAFEGVMGVRTIRYMGPFDLFNSFALEAEFDCTVHAGEGRDEFTFDFMAGCPMAFPAYDDALMAVGYKLTQEIAMKRLNDPRGLTDKNRGEYEYYLRRRIMPSARHAVTTNDIAKLKEVLATGLMSDGDLRDLLTASLDSGKTAATSVLMSFIRRRAAGKE